MRAKERESTRQLAWKLLEEYGREQKFLNQRIEQIVSSFDPSLRCAKPVRLATRTAEPLNGRFQLPPVPERATILAADGSQIVPDRHAEAEYGLINLGAIHMERGSTDPPVTVVKSMLYFDEGLNTETGQMSEGRLALERDYYERQIQSELSKDLPGPIISFTDGPMELWGLQDGSDATAYRQVLGDYLRVLADLHEMGVAAAGYVDKPAANMVLRTLEVAMLPEDELHTIRSVYPLRPVSDFWLFRKLLQPGERSAVFGIQSRSTKSYADELGLHFFYLNVGAPRRPSLARVEVPAWVVEAPEMLDNLHAVLVEQCRIMGQRSYPYLLHRAHETAVVSFQEKEQVTLMILQELRRRGVEVGELSDKQAAKDLQGRTRYRG